MVTWFRQSASLIKFTPVDLSPEKRLPLQSQMNSLRKFGTISQTLNDVDASEPLFYGVLMFSFVSLLVMLYCIFCCLQQNQLEDYSYVSNLNQQLIDNSQSLLTFPKTIEKKQLKAQFINQTKLTNDLMNKNAYKSPGVKQSILKGTYPAEGLNKLNFSGLNSFGGINTNPLEDIGHYNPNNIDSLPKSKILKQNLINCQKSSASAQCQTGQAVNLLKSKVFVSKNQTNSSNFLEYDNYVTEHDPSKRKGSYIFAFEMVLEQINSSFSLFCE